MHIDPKSNIAGYPALDIRKLMRRATQMWTTEFVAEVLGIIREEADELVHRLEKEGYVEREPDWDDLWRTTMLGNRLANASAARPITRAAANRVVTELLDRIVQVNSDNYYLYEVEKVVLFGSYLTDRERINDIDLAVTLAAKEKDSDRRFELDQERAADAAADGRRFRHIVDRLGWARNEVLLFLKSRSRSISLHEGDEWEQLGASGEILYPGPSST